MEKPKKPSLQQIPFRLHRNDHAELKSKAALDKLKIQTLVEACVLAYIDGDEHIRKLALEHRKLNTVDKKRFALSPREQRRMLDMIENEGGDDV